MEDDTGLSPDQLAHVKKIVDGAKRMKNKRSFGKGKRKSLFETQDWVPGPGRYEFNKPVKAQKNTQNTQPNLGEEDPEMWKEEQEEQLFKSYATAGPGPAGYYPKYSSKPNLNYSFGYRIELEPDEIKKTLGPGSYEPREAEKKSFSRIGSFSQSKVHVGGRKKSPGPGTYLRSGEIEKVSRSAPRYTISRSAKLAAPRTTNMQSPSPDSYTLTDMNKTQGPSWSIGFVEKPTYEKEEGSLSGTLGGGVNSSTEKLTAGKSNGRTSFLSHSYSSDLPGPGAYDPSPLGNSIGVKMKKHTTKPRRKTVSERSHTPGPGRYDANHPAHIKRNAFLGTSERPGMHSRQKTPGPGSYHWERVASEEKGAKYSLQKRRATSFIRGSDTPGPGAYDVSDSPERVRPFFDDQRSVSSGTAVRTATGMLKRTTGLSYQKSRESLRGASIGTGSRDALYNKSQLKTPGPGEYKTQTKARHERSLSYSFSVDKKRMFDQMSETPGPGAYNITKSTVGGSTTAGQFLARERALRSKRSVGSFDPNSSVQ